MSSGHKIIVGSLLALLLSAPAVAQEFTQGFGADEELLRGSIVSRVEGDDSKVEGSMLDSVDRMYGVVVHSNETPVTLTFDSSGVLVATAGRYEVLVSNMNGEVQEGDYLTASSIRGVAMKADDRQPRSLGQALVSFNTDDQNQVLTTEEVMTTEGEQRTVAIGRVLADLDVRNNPLAFGVQAPQILIEVGEAIAGGPVSVTRVWGALATLLLSFATGSIIFYAGVRTSLIAIGRNPLSKASILRGFLQVTANSLIIFIVGGFAVYLILKL